MKQFTTSTIITTLIDIFRKTMNYSGEPYYIKFSDDDLISYFYETNNNSQLHSRGWAKSKNSLIKQEVVKRDLEIDFDSDYKNIEFDIVTE